MNQYNIKITPEDIYSFDNIENIIVVYIEILAIIAGILCMLSINISENINMSKYMFIICFIMFDYIFM